MELSYQLCFLGYGQLSDLAREAAAELNYPDMRLTIVDSTPDTQTQIVSAALNEGTEVFIAGGANAATFTRNGMGHLQEIVIRDIDYLIAIKAALEIGERPAVFSHRFSRDLNVALLSKLANAKVQLYTFEDSAELYHMVEHTDCDVVVSTAQACEYAEKLGKKNVLVYAGKDTVKRSIVRARRLAIELRKEQNYREINRALLRDIPLGVIVTYADGQVHMINQIASDYLGVPVNAARGRLLSDLAPNLSPESLFTKGLQQNESYKILNGVRMRCTQRRISVKGFDIGVLTTLRIDNSKKTSVQTAGATPGAPFAAASWKELTALSESMREAVKLGKAYADSPLPLTISGDVSTNKQAFAECVHTGSSRAQQPLSIVNLSSVSESEAGRLIFGSVDKQFPQTGILEYANNGTLILKNLQHANDAVQDCLLDAISNNCFTPNGSFTPIPINIRFITLINTPMSESCIRPDLYRKLTTLSVALPALSKRGEDIPALFNQMIAQRYDHKFDITRYARASETLAVYRWPGNNAELEAVADRFVALLGGETRFSAHVVHRNAVLAIGEDTLFCDLLSRFPELTQKDCPAGIMREATERLKYYVGINNAEIAERLGMSRTTLWRALSA